MERVLFSTVTLVVLIVFEVRGAVIQPECDLITHPQTGADCCLDDEDSSCLCSETMCAPRGTADDFCRRQLTYDRMGEICCQGGPQCLCYDEWASLVTDGSKNC